MKKVQVYVKNGLDRTKYYDVIIDNKQTVVDAINIIKTNRSTLGISYLADIGRGMSGVQAVEQYNKHKPGTVLDGDWNSYGFGEVLIKGGK